MALIYSAFLSLSNISVLTVSCITCSLYSEKWWNLEKLPLTGKRIGQESHVKWKSVWEVNRQRRAGL